MSFFVSPRFVQVVHQDRNPTAARQYSAQYGVQLAKDPLVQALADPRPLLVAISVLMHV